MKSNEFIWAIMGLAVFVLLGYAASGDTEAIAMFALGALVASACTDNVAIIFGVAILGAGLSTLAGKRVEAFVEGVGKKSDEEEKEPEGSEDKKDDSKPDKSIVKAADSATDTKAGKKKESMEGLRHLESLIGRVEGLMDRFHSKR